MSLRLGVRLGGIAALALLVFAQPAPARLRAAELFAPPQLRQVVINPAGTLLASVEAALGWDRVIVRRRDEAEGVVTFEQVGEMPPIRWIDDRHLLIGDRRVVTVAEDDAVLTARVERISAQGELVNPLPQHGEQVLWAVSNNRESRVYRARISELLREEGVGALDADRYPLEATLVGCHIDVWVADRDGRVRAGLCIERSGRSQLWHRHSPEEGWKLVLESDDEEDFPIPFGIEASGRDLIVLARGSGDTLALYRFDLEAGGLGPEIFSIPDADIQDILLDYSGEIIGASYERNGLVEYRHFDSFHDRYQRSLEAVFPNRAVQLASFSRDQRFFVAVTEGPREPGTFYLLDVATHTAREIGRTRPWLAEDRLYDVEALRVPSGELEIEAFLSRPRPSRNGSPSPLLVLPHGGPLGVRDRRGFEPLVQYLSDAGIAVLQVNYRGSAGRGRSFFEAGSREWGQGIEDDIEAALDAATAREWIDGDRICIAGGSYGGYSALISAVRSDRYRCAASVNGPTDLPFAYYSRFQLWKEGSEYFTEHVGDVENDYDGLIAISPAYRAGEIRVPVLLIQGTDDPVVNVEHYYRLKTMLELLGKPHEGMLIQGGGHSPTVPEWVHLAQSLRRFLTRHLGVRREDLVTGGSGDAPR